MAELSVFYSIACFGAFILEFIINIGEKGTAALYPAIPALCGVFASAFFRIFLKKERKGIPVLLCGTLFFVAVAATEWKLCSLSGFAAWAITLFINAYILVTAFSLVMAPGRFSSLIGYFDWSLILLFIVLLLEGKGSLIVISSLHFILCALLCGVSLIRNRVVSQNMTAHAPGGTLRVTAVTSLLLSAAAGLAFITAKPFGILLVSFVNFLRRLISALLGLIDRFLLWLASFMTQSESGMEFGDPAEHFTLPAAEEQPLPSNAFLLYAFIVLVCLALLVVLVLALKNMRFGKFKTKAAIVGKRRTGSSLLALLLKNVRAACEAVKYRFYLKFRRDTVLGVFLNLEHSMKRTTLARFKGETPAGFLSRCAAAADSEGEVIAAGALRRLMDAVNQTLYSSAPDNPGFNEAHEIRAWAAEKRN